MPVLEALVQLTAALTGSREQHGDGTIGTSSTGDFPYLGLFLCFTLLVYVFHTYLDFRQLKVINHPLPPPELKDIFDQDLYLKTQAYSKDKWWFGLWHGLFDALQNVAFFLYFLLPKLWRLSGWLLRHVFTHPGGYRSKTLEWFRSAEVPQAVVFVLLLVVLNMVLELPWGLHSTFVIEARHGFNKQTMGLYLSDILKQICLICVLVPPAVAAMTIILQHASPWMPLQLWGCVLCLALIQLTIYPTLIAPLFNKFEPLPEGSLRDKIEALAGSLKFPLRKLYTMDGSKRSAHSNAYMYGFFKNKRIVLYDTLISQCTQEEVVAVLAHELGHWKLRHTASMFVLQQATLLANFLLFSYIRNSAALFRSFGFVDQQPAFVSLVLFQFIASPIDEVLHFLINLISRTFEFQADRFAVSLHRGAELRSALLALERHNKSAMHVDPWFSTFHYSHPPLVERLKAIDRASRKAAKKAS